MGYSACFCYSRLLPVVFQISAHLIGTGIVHTLHLGPDVCGRQTGYALGMGRAVEIVHPAVLLQHPLRSCHHRGALSVGSRGNASAAEPADETITEEPRFCGHHQLPSGLYPSLVRLLPSPSPLRRYRRGDGIRLSDPQRRLGANHPEILPTDA